MSRDDRPLRSETFCVSPAVLARLVNNDSLRPGGLNFSKNICTPSHARFHSLSESFEEAGVRPTTTNMNLSPFGRPTALEFVEDALAASHRLAGPAKNVRLIGGREIGSSLLLRSIDIHRRRADGYTSCNYDVTTSEIQVRSPRPDDGVSFCVNFAGGRAHIR